MSGRHQTGSDHLPPDHWRVVLGAGERLKQTGHVMRLEAAFSEQGSLGRRLRDLDDGKTYL